MWEYKRWGENIFKGYTHATFSLASFVAIINYFNLGPHIPSLAYIAVLVGGILPDIDTPYSLIGKFNPFVNMMRHRGKCHTPIGIFLLAFPFLLFTSYFPFVVYGELTHLLIDSFTKMGIRWLYPINRKYYSFGLCPNRSIKSAWEGIIFAGSLLYLWNG